MAVQKIIPGGTIDAVTPRELRALLARELRDAPGRNITASEDGITDASGRVSIPVYKCPDGMEFELGWVTIEIAGTSFAAPVVRTNAGAQVDVNGAPRDFLFSFQDPAAPGNMELVLPFRKEYSSGGAIRVRNGSVVGVSLNWGVNNLVAVATIGGRLYSTPPTEVNPNS